ncbi:MAG: multifunctional CCA addition/repair protein [Gammaproteobacteria bacterium]|nr:multifunctional CCA addition/repair protein [Gammaproteobacteria bacterium]
MRHYLVGGAVRDKLLGLPVRERDWLVTGADCETLLRSGYQPVGKSFGIFLHPETKEEHALPRGEATTDEHAQVVRDLQLRDLTINAIALSPEGEYIDPLDGRRDLQRRLLRHAPGFREDPLRILRLARFAARFCSLGFRIADETLTLARQMAAGTEFRLLAPERCWKEIEKGLTGSDPVRFFSTLRALGALKSLTPELERLFGVPQPERHHPEIDTGVHSLLTLRRAVELSPDSAVRLAALLHDLGKGTTPEAEWPRHIGHEGRGAALVEKLCRRVKVPTRHRELATLTAELHTHCHRALELKEGTVLKMFKRLDALRRPERLHDLLLACTADLRGRPGYESHSYPQADYLTEVLEELRALRPDLPPQLAGEAVGRFIDRQRIATIARLRRQWQAT